MNDNKESKEQKQPESKPVTYNAPLRRETPYERTKRQVYATGNKWAIENFHATHD